MKLLSEEAEVMLIILSANGGEMTKDDAFQEWKRVMDFTPEERAVWRQRVLPLAKHHAKAHLDENS